MCSCATVQSKSGVGVKLSSLCRDRTYTQMDSSRRRRRRHLSGVRITRIRFPLLRQRYRSFVLLISARTMRPYVRRSSSRLSVGCLSLQISGKRDALYDSIISTRVRRIFSKIELHKCRRGSRHDALLHGIDSSMYLAFGLLSFLRLYNEITRATLALSLSLSRAFQSSRAYLTWRERDDFFV